jgi:hypothetical protein
VPLRAADQSLDNPDPTAPSRHFRATTAGVANKIRSLLQHPG